MELKIVISDPETGKAYQQELKDDRAIRFKGKKLGDEISGSVLGLEGYTLKITGGSDRCGFPIKPGVHGTARPKILMTEGIGYHPKRKVRSKKRVRGESIDEDITQVNTKVVKKGRKDIAELLGAGGEEGEAAEAKPGEQSASPEPEAKPVEEKSVEEPKSEEPKQEEQPAEEVKPEEKPAEEPKVEELKPEEKPAEEPKPEEPKAEEKPVEEKPAEEVKPEEPKSEEKPAEAEEKPVEEAEKPAEENKA